MKVNIMFDKIERWVGKLTRTATPFDPGTLDDPIALRTSWNAAKPGGASFRTRQLVVVDSDRMAFKSTLGSMLFCFAFIGMGLMAMIVFPIGAMSDGGGVQWPAVIFPVLIGGIFVAVGWGMFYFGLQPVVFDLGSGWFWKGKNDPTKLAGEPDPEKACELATIYALQIISEYVSGNKNSYYSYELNAVLLEGERINIVDHGSLKHLRADAKQLGEFIGVPVWDAA